MFYLSDGYQLKR